MEALRILVSQYQDREELGLAFKAFGRTDMGIIEVSPQHLASVAAWFRSNEGLRFDWLELLSAHERRDRLHFSYFIRSQLRSESCILRTSLEIPHADEPVKLPSLTHLWPMLHPYEEECFRLFGVSFEGAGARMVHDGRGEFPLRKSFSWPGVEPR